MEKCVTFKVDGYDRSIDYIKGLSILFVVLTHCINVPMHQYSLFCLWGDMAVPLFLLIQTFHAYKKGLKHVKFNFHKVYVRVLQPFLLIQVLLFALMVVGGGKINVLMVEFLESGGQGAGSYYVWIYVQFAFVLPLLAPLFVKVGKWAQLSLFILLSEMLEVFCSEVYISSWLYRLLMFRYVILIWFGLQIINEGIKLSKIKIAISIISAVMILFFNYTDTNMRPFFFHTSWRVFHWPCYFYVSYILLFILRKSYDYTIKVCPKVNELIVKMGRYSFEIFLLQMVYFFFLAYLRNKLVYLQSSCMVDAIILVISPIISILPVLIYKQVKTKTVKL